MARFPIPVARLCLPFLPFLFAACQTRTPDANAPAITPDSAYIESIDKLLDSVTQALNDSLPLPPRVPIPWYSEKDSLLIWLSEGKSGQVQAHFFPGESQIWPTYYFQSGKILLVRFREWRNEPVDPVIRESMVYYKDGKPAYCLDRSMIPKPADLPVMLRDLPFAPTQRPLAEIAESYAMFWPKLIELDPGLGTLEHP